MNPSAFPRMHVSLYVSDLQRSLQFYTDFFGEAPTKVKHRYAKYTLASPSLIISFVENPERVQQNFGHLGFQLETLEQLNAKLHDARVKNLVSKEEIGTNCCYAKQDKFWANDPDGIQWEVYYFHEDAEFNDPHYDMEEKADACCTVSSESVKSSCGCSANVQGVQVAEKAACC
jgi:catechol 2,3-dioxygenase-like lactoylglutathione lyase family enzyme